MCPWSDVASSNATTNIVDKRGKRRVELVHSPFFISNFPTDLLSFFSFIRSKKALEKLDELCRDRMKGRIDYRE